MRMLCAVAFAILATTPGQGQAEDTTTGNSALAEALDLLLAPSVDQDGTPLPVPSITVRLRADDGAWFADGVALDNNTLSLPLDQVVELQVTASDTIYEMTVPKLDMAFLAIPGRIETLFVTFHEPGIYPATCVAPCGTGGGALVFRIE